MADKLMLVLVIGAVAVLAGLLGWLLASLRAQRRLTELSTTLDLERKQAVEKQTQLDARFATLSQQALKESNATFLQLAQESLKQFHVQAKSDLEQKEKAVENLVKPIREALDKTSEQIRQIEKERQESYGALTSHLKGMAETQQLLHGETSKLVSALRRPEVRGQWGELTLKRLTELAGMVEHCDFYQQENLDTDQGRMRPDMIVRLPGGRVIVVDVKTPLDAYLNAVEAGDDETRRKQLEHHARKVRERVRELASKNYWSQFESAPDFVVLFIPGDQFLSAALDHDRDLLEDALRQRVILATPISLVALLRAVAYGWRQATLAENTQRIRELGEDLYNRLATFSEHLVKLGRSLEGTVIDFNKAVGSYETKILPGARKFPEMGISGVKTLEEPVPLEKSPRPLTRDG